MKEIVTKKLSKEEMDNTHLGDIRVSDGQYFIVIKWYYYYITMRKLSIIELYYIVVKNMIGKKIKNVLRYYYPDW